MSNFRIFCVCFAAFMYESGASAQTPSIKVNPDPIVFGQACDYSIENPPTYISSYLWEYKFLSPVSTDWAPLTPNNTTSNQVSYEGLPGSFQIRCTIKYFTSFYNPFSQTMVLEKSVTVPKPDGYTILGRGVSVPLNNIYLIQFQITQNGNAASYIAGFAQERVRNFLLYDYSGNPYGYIASSGWVPTSSSDPLAAGYVIVGGNIYDYKLYDDSSRNQYATRPLNDLLETLEQDIRIIFTYPTGYVDYVNLPSTSFSYRVTGMNSYKID